jgi:hypothetical protein
MSEVDGFTDRRSDHFKRPSKRLDLKASLRIVATRCERSAGHVARGRQHECAGVLMGGKGIGNFKPFTN